MKRILALVAVITGIGTITGCGLVMSKNKDNSTDGENVIKSPVIDENANFSNALTDGIYALQAPVVVNNKNYDVRISVQVDDQVITDIEAINSGGSVSVQHLMGC